MQIEGNEKQLEAMEAFHRGDRREGLRLQEEFAAWFREEYKEKEISVEKFVSLVLDRSIEKQNLSRNAHQEFMSMCC
mgnify:CR=1 FL=1